MERKDVGQYDVRFDSQRFLALRDLEGTIDYQSQLKKELKFTRKQLETDNKERLNVQESHFIYEIRNGSLYGEGDSVPFEISLRKAAENKSEYTREHADLDAFMFYQKVLASPETPNGTMVFNPSPPDEKNKMNFLDVHTKVGDTVHSVRYLSNLSNYDYREKIIGINPAYSEIIPENPTDKDFLKNPVIVPDHLDLTPDRLADYFIPERKSLGISPEKHQEIWKDLSPQITSMINTLVENPEAIENIEDNYARIQVKATELAGGINYLLKSGGDGVIVYIDEKPQMISGGGCGGAGCTLGGSNFDNLSKVESSGMKDEYGDLNYKCPSCKQINKRTPGKLDSNCPGCGSDEVLPPAARKMLN